MAGGSNHPKGSSHKASSSFSASASHRKSRWESSTTTVAANTKNPSAGDPKQPKSKNDPSPKSGPTPSPAHSKPLTDPPHHPGAAGPVPSPGAVFPFMDPAAMGPPPPPAYGFHMLERRTIVLADGSVRSYFALPLDYQDLPPPPPPRPLDPAGRFLPVGPGGLGHHELGGGFDRRLPPAGGPMSPGGFNRHQDYWNSLGLDGRGHMEGSMKRKFTEEEEKDLRRDEKEELLKQRQQFMQYGHQNGFPVAGPGGRGGQFLSGASGEESRAAKYMRIGDSYENIGLRQSGGGGGGGGGGSSSGNVGLKHLEVDQNALKKAFLNFCKLINENPHQRKNYLEEGKLSRLQCIACGRSSKEFPDMHSLIMHTYNSDNADLHVDHLGLHKALCALMGWNYSKPPDNSKAYQFLSADEAAKNQDDLIIWPPMVIIHNTITGKGKDGRMEGFGNKAMDNIIRDLGFTGGKSKSLYGREGHLGVTLMKFAGDQAGLKDAIHLAEFFEKDNRGRKAWTRLQPLTIGSKDDENNPNLVKYDEKSRERKRVFYGYLGTAFDLDKIDFDTRKKVAIESKREYRSSKLF